MFSHKWLSAFALMTFAVVVSTTLQDKRELRAAVHGLFRIVANPAAT